MAEAVDRFVHLRGLEAHLRANILAQDHLVPRVAAVFARGQLGVTDPTRPRGSLLLVGPTGTGKSETFACATDYVFGPGHLLVFGMSEYQDPSAVNKLLGANREDPGLLGRTLLAHPYGALFFDELDKAYPALLDVFLQMLWDGCVTVATGQTFRLSSYYVGFASNVGGAEAMRMERSSFASVERAILRRVRQTLRSEFFSRIDEVLVFQRLSPDAQRAICALVLGRETARLRRLGFDLQVSRDAMEFLVREGFDPQLGARPLRKTIEQQLQNAIVSDLFARGIGRGTVTADPVRRRLLIQCS